MSEKVYCLLDGIEMLASGCNPVFTTLTDPSEIDLCRSCDHHPFKDEVAADAGAENQEPASVASDPVPNTDPAIMPAMASDLPGVRTIVVYPSQKHVLEELARRAGVTFASVSYCYYMQWKKGKKPKEGSGSTGEKLLAWLTAHCLSWEDVAECKFLSADDPGIGSNTLHQADAHAPEQSLDQDMPAEQTTPYEPRPDPAFPLPSLPVPESEAAAWAGVKVTDACPKSRPATTADPLWHDPASPVFEQLVKTDPASDAHGICDPAPRLVDLDPPMPRFEDIEADNGSDIVRMTREFCVREPLTESHEPLEALLAKVRDRLPRGATLTITL